MTPVNGPYQKLQILENALKFGVLTASITQKDMNRLRKKIASLKRRLMLKNKPTVATC